MASKKHGQTWVSPRGKDWAVHHPNSQRASGVFENKSDAVDFGRQVSRNQRTEFIVQGRDGQIQYKDSHGNDPRSIKG